MSNASNLGYGNISPYAGLNGALVNGNATNAPLGFSSNETGLQASGGHGMLGASNNVAAAAGCVTGACNMTQMQKGGRRRRANNMRVNYRRSRKMRHRTRRRTRRRTRSRLAARSRSLSRQLALYSRRMSAMQKQLAMGRTASRRGGTGGIPRASFGMTGGYHQFSGNVPQTSTFSTAGVNLSPSLSGLASPPPITRMGCIGSSCQDNYNHYTNKGAQMWN